MATVPAGPYASLIPFKILSIIYFLTNLALLLFKNIIMKGIKAPPAVTAVAAAPVPIIAVGANFATAYCKPGIGFKPSPFRS
jgi:hypothetical protein